MLVTGGAGYIGSHVCAALAAAGYRPVTVDSLARGHRWAVRWGPLETVDITNGPALDAVFARHRPDAVIHLAGVAYVGESVTAPLFYYRVNVAGTLCLLESMVRAACPLLVFSSSCTTYGLPDGLPITETHPQAPISPYGRAKLIAEGMMADAEAAGGPRHVALRYFNAAGASPCGTIGEAHDPETHLIPLTLAAATGMGPPLTVFGDDYPTPDGTCMRDYIHVTDLARAHLLALRSLAEGMPSARINLGIGKGFSVREVIKTVEQVTAFPVPYTIGPRRPGDPPALVADASLARTVLGWTPEHTTLESMVTDAWRWMRAWKDPDV